MASDAHAHPENLLHIFPEAEEERTSLGIACAASSSSREEFIFHEKLASAAIEDNAPPLYLCFAVHPQLPAYKKTSFQDETDFLVKLAEEKRIAAVGETGFDLYSAQYRDTETIQEEIFARHLEIAHVYNLPVVIHIRRAMHKIFPHIKTLKSLPAVIFHSWPGVPDEALALLRKGIRAFYSFGTTLLLNHKNAIRSCAELPIEHVLLETDAPYQPLKGKEFSSWKDLPLILEAAAAIRKEAGTSEGTNQTELEELTDRNFFNALKCK